MEYFDFIGKVQYEGPKSKNPYAFKFYDANEVIMGKPMKDHLKFAMAWWHNLGANGVDMFGRGTIDKRFGAAEEGTMEHAKAKVDAGIEFMQKLGIEYYCFHDVDLVPEADDINETNRRLDELTDYLKEKTNNKEKQYTEHSLQLKNQYDIPQKLYFHEETTELKELIEKFNGYIPPKGIYYHKNQRYLINQRRYLECHVTNLTYVQQLNKTNIKKDK